MHKNCIQQFSREHAMPSRANAAQLTRNELDMVLLGQLMAFTPCSEQHQERNRAVFYHEGNKICKNTFWFLHNIGNFHLKALKEHLYSKGLVPRIHGHSSRTAPNALVLEDVRNIITFILEYTEVLEYYYLGEFLGTKGMIFNCFHQVQQNVLFGKCFKTAQLPRLPELSRIRHSAKCGRNL